MANHKESHVHFNFCLMGSTTQREGSFLKSNNGKDKKEQTMCNNVQYVMNTNANTNTSTTVIPTLDGLLNGPMGFICKISQKEKQNN